MTTEERLEKLERTTRRYRILLGVVVLGVVVLGPRLLMEDGGTEEAIVSAKRFQLVDDRGETLALLSSSEGEPGLALFDDKGELRTMLTMTEAGSKLIFNDDKGVSRMLLDEPGLSLFDDKGEHRVGLFVTEGGSGLGLTDNNGKTRVLLGVHPDTLGLALYDDEGGLAWSTPSQ